METFPNGFDGRLSLKEPGFLTADEAGHTLARLGALISWAQAQQAQVVARIEKLFARDIVQTAGREDHAWAQSLAAAEVGAILHLPHMSALRLVNESNNLCTGTIQTLERLSEGRISYQHARVVLDEVQYVPDDEREGGTADESGGEDLLGLLEGSSACSTRAQFETDLLAHAEGLTAARFTAKARRLRESLFPGTIPVRHKDALAKRRVCFEALPDGMSCVSAFLAAENGLAIHTALSVAARSEKAAGDERSMDQLRADILGSLLLDGRLPATRLGDGGEVGSQDRAPIPDQPSTRRRMPPAGHRSASGGTMTHGQVSGPRGEPGTHKTESSASAGDASGFGTPGRPYGRKVSSRKRGAHRKGMRTEVMVLINADTLAGMDEAPVELNGYGPLSPEAGRRMIYEALSWTPLVQDPTTGAILGVGRRRRIPSGLKRWLQARDGTCRFPGCGVNAQVSQIDHTRPWAQGGNTEHSNLEHLCPKHHRFKTLGHWKATQPEPGSIQWTSPTGRRYRTAPMLGFGTGKAPEGEWNLPAPAIRQGNQGNGESMHRLDGNLQDLDPPPF
ncbi:DUF222 domain-containing protein [Arthrobacter sp.]|uniref:HNH endonuclease signature motif containing protein n=1 Tax=Arthrobacter sp. TaxID=1667 RepID=UPI0028A2257F|nr:DUF222 domain-containing protein [Arthrobacter sp.]